MKHSTYTSYDELPLMLSVAEVAAVPKDKFLAWIDANSGSKNAPL